MFEPTKKTSLLGTENKSASLKYNSFNHSSPVMSCVEHTLSPSDTLQGLAIKYGVKVADIRKANNMWAQDNIHLKKVLLIPSKVGAPVPDGAGSSPKKIHPRGDSLAPLNHVSPDLRPTSHLSRTPITAHTSAELREQQFANHDDLFSL